MELLRAVQNGNLEYVKDNIDTDTWFKNTPWSDYILLNESIHCNRRKITKFLLDMNCRVNREDEMCSGNTPLHGAVAKKNIQLVNILLSKNASVDVKNGDGETPIHLAAKSKKCELVNLLMPHMKTGADLNFINRNGLSHLHVASMSNNVAAVKNFIRYGEDIKCPVNMNSPFWPGFTSLHFAVHNNRSLMAEVLLVNGADPNVTDARGVTPLHLAFRKKNQYLVTIMLKRYNAGNVNLVDDMKISYFHIACSQNDSAILDAYLLQELDIDGCISPTSSFLPGCTPLHVAVLYACNNTVSWLLNRRASFTKCNSDGFTPLHLAFWRKEYKLIDLFLAAILKYNLYENPVDIRGVSFFHISCMRNNPLVLRGFIIRGADVNKPIKRSAEKLATCTPLHLAVRFENPENVIELLVNGADMNAVDIKGETPLHYLCQGNDDKLEALMQVIRDMYWNHRDPSVLLDHLNKSYFIFFAFVEKKVDVNIKDKSGRTPIFHLYNRRYDVEIANRMCRIIPLREETYWKRVIRVITECRNRIIKAILLLKTDMKLKDSRGFTLLHLLVGMQSEFIKGQEEIAQLMLENGAEVDAVNDFDETPLFMAVKDGKETLVDILLMHGANVNIYVETNQVGISPTPLAVAVDYLLFRWGGHKSTIVGKLIKHGAEVNERLTDGRTVLHDACGSGKFRDDRECKILCVDNCELDVQEETKGKTPLHLATEIGDVTAVDWLLQCGARYDIKDYQGFDPVHYCAQDPKKIGHVYYNHFQRLRLIGYKFDSTLEANIALIKKGCTQENLLDDDQYLEELEALKKVAINKYTTLYSLLFQSPQEMAKYVNNTTVQQMLDRSTYSFVFPLYGSLIEAKYQKGRARFSLLKPSVDSFNILTANTLPENVSNKVLGFLSDADVNNVISASKINLQST